jgi:uncharacterized protein (UPF0332 family)
MHNELEKLINYRKQQSFDTIKEVQFQIDNGYLTIAVNRIYYGMFYLLLALSLKHGIKTSKHQQLLGWFNKEFIKTGIVDNKYGKIILLFQSSFCKNVFRNFYVELELGHLKFGTLPFFQHVLIYHS